MNALLKSEGVSEDDEEAKAFYSEEFIGHEAAYNKLKGY